MTKKFSRLSCLSAFCTIAIAENTEQAETVIQQEERGDENEDESIKIILKGDGDNEDDDIESNLTQLCKSKKDSPPKTSLFKKTPRFQQITYLQWSYKKRHPEESVFRIITG
ncbi:MAG: hypothetical protein LBF70_00725 [Holosporales bacterium]|jgi:hypothetical protein|nr:hypothetical protein [Holosporales bacterium]